MKAAREYNPPAQWLIFLYANILLEQQLQATLSLTKKQIYKWICANVAETLIPNQEKNISPQLDHFMFLYVCCWIGLFIYMLLKHCGMVLIGDGKQGA